MRTFMTRACHILSLHIVRGHKPIQTWQACYIKHTRLVCIKITGFLLAFNPSIQNLTSFKSYPVARDWKNQPVLKSLCNIKRITSLSSKRFLNHSFHPSSRQQSVGDSPFLWYLRIPSPLFLNCPTFIITWSLPLLICFLISSIKNKYIN